MKNINSKIANLFYEIANFLKMEEISFKPFAYERAALTLESLDEDVGRIYEQGGKKALEKIPGIGKSIAEKIEEYLKTGEIKYYHKLKKKVPIDIEELTRVEGMGPKRAKILYEKLGIKNLKDLEKKAKAGKIAPLFGFGEKTEKNILQGISFLKKSSGRFLLGEILPIVSEIEKRLRNLKEINEISVAGSIRRKKETIGDIDFLVTIKEFKKPIPTRSSAEKIMDFFVSMKDVIKVWGKGPTKSSIRLESGLDIDLRVVPQKSYGAALQYFTGSKEHNIETRKIAMDMGLKLSEYGLFKGRKMIAGRSEKEIYRILKMQWMPPEMRENQGEIELARVYKLPKIVEVSDIKGDLHCHSKWDGGVNSILELSEEALKMEYKYLGISDHTKFLRIEHGLNEKQLSLQKKEIDKLNSEFRIQDSEFRVFQGAETNILKDGSIDIKDEALKKLDYAIAGIHSSFKMRKKEMTDRIIKAMKNPYIKIISHPTGRILKKRDEYQVDFPKILRAAKEFKTVLEINSYPERLDLNDNKIRQAKEAGVKMVINTDAHHKNQLHYMELGVFQARRGWAEKKDIINTKSQDKLLKYLK